MKVSKIAKALGIPKQKLNRLVRNRQSHLVPMGSIFNKKMKVAINAKQFKYLEMEIIGMAARAIKSVDGEYQLPLEIVREAESLHEYMKYKEFEKGTTNGN